MLFKPPTRNILYMPVLLQKIKSLCLVLPQLWEMTTWWTTFEWNLILSVSELIRNYRKIQTNIMSSTVSYTVMILFTYSHPDTKYLNLTMVHSQAVSDVFLVKVNTLIMIPYCLYVCGINVVEYCAAFRQAKAGTLNGTNRRC